MRPDDHGFESNERAASGQAGKVSRITCHFKGMDFILREMGAAEEF